MKIGILTGGGDAPGLNSVIRAAVKRGEQYGHLMIGIKYGWKGLLDLDYEELTFDKIEDIYREGGTILKTSRTNPFAKPDGPQKIFDSIKKIELDALVAIGGDDTLGATYKLYQLGLKVIGVPKTIDNDLNITDYTFGFDTAVNEAMHALDNLKTTGRSHDRIMIAEVMGRNAGWIAAYSGIAAGANLILVPEEPFDLNEIIEFIKKRYEKGYKNALIVVAEGARLKNINENFIKEGKVDEFGHPILGGIGEFIAKEIETRTNFEVRYVSLGHTIRGGEPSAFDRVLASRFGIASIDLVQQNKFGYMVALKGLKIEAVPLSEAVTKMKCLSEDIFSVAKALFY
ncbi:MAG: 6-phosphofructokinase [Caldisphaera sp.]